MDKLDEIVSELEKKINRLICKADDLQRKNQDLADELDFYKRRFEQTELVIGELQAQLNVLKTSNALLGSDEYRRETKLKINALVKDIDYCITQLAD